MAGLATFFFCRDGLYQRAIEPRDRLGHIKASLMQCCKPGKLAFDIGALMVTGAMQPQGEAPPVIF